MEVETLRELIAAFQTLGGEAKEAFVWYLVLEYVPAYVIGLVWTCIGGFTAVQLLRSMRELIANGRLREAAGVHVMWSEDEMASACDVLRKARTH